MTGVQLYDSGTTAVEAALRVCRAATGKSEFLSCFRDFHGKSGHAVSLARMNRTSGAARAPGFYMLPRPEPYRPLFKKADGTIDTDAYLDFFDEFIDEGDRRTGGGIRAWSPSRAGPDRSSRRTISSPS